MDIESTQDTKRRSPRPFAIHNYMLNQEEELACKLETSLNFDQPIYQNLQNIRAYNVQNIEENLFTTPEKGTSFEGAGARGYCQTTKSKVNRDMIDQDRFSTPPRRPQRPTSQQLEGLLREERDYNRRR